MNGLDKLSANEQSQACSGRQHSASVITTKAQLENSFEVKWGNLDVWDTANFNDYIGSCPLDALLYAHHRAITRVFDAIIKYIH